MIVSRIYRHYGSDVFDPEFLRSSLDVKSFLLSKPRFGLWASPIDSKNNWYDWCLSEDFHVECLNEYFDFVLSKDANIYVINSEQDYQNLVNQFPEHNSVPWKAFSHRLNNTDLDDGIDFLAVSEKYDGVEVNLSSDYRLYHVMPTWDVDSLVVWNPSVVKVV